MRMKPEVKAALAVIAVASVVLSVTAKGDESTQVEQPSERKTELTTSDRSMLVGVYAGTMGNGVRLSLNPGASFAPVSLTLAKRDVTVKDVEGTPLETRRNVAQLAYEPGIRWKDTAITSTLRIQPRVAFPLGISAGWNDEAANQALAFEPGPLPGTGQWVVVDIPMAAGFRETRYEAFAGMQASIDVYSVDSRFMLSIGARGALGTPLSGKFDALVREDVTGVGAFVALGIKF